MLLLGVPTVIAGALAHKLIETSKRNLPATMDDARKMVRNLASHQEIAGGTCSESPNIAFQTNKNRITPSIASPTNNNNHASEKEDKATPAGIENKAAELSAV